MNCKDAEGLLQAYHDGELAPSKRTLVESHLADCPACQARLAELASLDALIVDGDAEKVPDPGTHYWGSFSHRVTRRIAAIHEPHIPRRRPARFFHWRLIPYLSAGIAIVIVVILSLTMFKDEPILGRFTADEVAEAEEVLTADEAPRIRDEAGEMVGVVSGEVDGDRDGVRPAVAPSTVSGFKPDADVMSADRSELLEDRAANFAEADEGAGAQTLGGAAAVRTTTDATTTAAEPSSGKTGEEAESAPSPAVSQDIEVAETQTERQTVISAARELLPEFGAQAKVGEEEAVAAEVGYAATGQVEDLVATPAQGTLQVVIDSAGQLIEVAILKTSGDVGQDSSSRARYWAENINTQYDRRKQVLLIPFPTQAPATEKVQE